MHDRRSNSIKLKALYTYCHATCISGRDISHRDENSCEVSIAAASRLQHTEGARKKLRFASEKSRVFFQTSLESPQTAPTEM